MKANMIHRLTATAIIPFCMLINNTTQAQPTVQIVETSAAGRNMQTLQPGVKIPGARQINILPEKRFQAITGFGGSFTEASAHLLNRLSKPNREKIVNAYFSREGANYSLTRTHINSCDFSISQYAYAMTPGDKSLQQFSIDEDANDLIPMIQDAMKTSVDGFKIIASPWTAPPWMKDNNDWRGGKLLPEYRDTWALYFSKYIKAYRAQGIPIWGITVENEPLGNSNNWESMHFTPEEMRDFVRDYLGPKLHAEGLSDIVILGYDQNRGEELERWANIMLGDPKAASYLCGMAVHWYASTYDYFPASLDYTHKLAPGKHLINTEACVDAEVPKWKDDAWYWKAEATDWGWEWASEKEKHLHPKYTPVFRYANDIIGCLNHYVDGWVDWNMVLDKQGGPNWFKNWCVAPVIVDPEADEIYFTPLYYTMAHFSKYIRPGAVRIGFDNPDPNISMTAAQNPDGSIAVILFNPGNLDIPVQVSIHDMHTHTMLSGKSLQTILMQPKK